MPPSHTQAASPGVQMGPVLLLLSSSPPLLLVSAPLLLVPTATVVSAMVVPVVEPMPVEDPELEPSVPLVMARPPGTGVQPTNATPTTNP